MCDPISKDEANARLRRLDAQILELNRQIASQPRMIAGAVARASDAARRRPKPDV